MDQDSIPDMFANFKYDGFFVLYGFMLAWVFEWKKYSLISKIKYENLLKNITEMSILL